MPIRRITYPNQYHDRLLQGMSVENDISYSKAIQQCVESYFSKQSTDTIQKYLSKSKYK